MKERYCYNSKQIQKGDVYICLPKGEAYVDDAKARGASRIVTMSRKEMGTFADKHFGHPSNSLCVIGVTGTNGKTTICHALGQALTLLGYKPFVLGTLNSNLTTPESLDTHTMMAEHLEQGGTHFIMEVSSHGIHQDRLSGIQFAIKILSNITQDHLDYHDTFEEYKQTKLSFLKDYPGASIHPRDYQQIEVPSGHQFKGEFNVSNLQAVIAVLRELDISEDKVSNMISQLYPPPGRFESINEGQDFDVIVDYAHTPDGLENVLSTARDLLGDDTHKLICVFGCGGDRDRGKRPKMGAVAERLADFVVLTQDNPRSESTETIVNDILVGMDPSRDILIENDRFKAIAAAIGKASKGDIVLIAGKGHERIQILNSGVIEFSDRDEVRKILKGRYESIH
jgi:UDP-N-acetylmuramoyl-L-alanyl-D-glutamate--2,6-diaminopimelate ligase